MGLKNNVSSAKCRMNSSYRRLDAFEDVEQGGNRSKKVQPRRKSSGDGSVGFGTSVLTSFVQDYASSPAEMLVSKSALREGDGLGSASKQFDALHSPVVLASTNNVPGVIATSPFIKRRKGSLRSSTQAPSNHLCVLLAVKRANSRHI